MTPENAQWFAQSFDQLVGNIERVIVGKTRTVRLALTALLSEGHLLLEDVPGTGKTMLARAIANTVTGTQSRIQFTPDLLPSDVIGVTVYDQSTSTFDFHPGPVFANVVLADEINRASPKTQSALLEVMEEGRVSVDGKTHTIKQPFIVIATQNPVEHAGTYALPEAQLDRFMMRTSLGYPDLESAVMLLGDAANRNRSADANPLITPEAVVGMTGLADQVHVDPNVLTYVVRLAEETRRAPEVQLGVSMRGCLSFVRAAKTWAASNGREYVTPDDIKALAEPVMAHRIVLDPDAQFEGATVDAVVARALTDVRPPSSRAA